VVVTSCALLIYLVLPACQGLSTSEVRPFKEPVAAPCGEEIIVAGARVPIGTRVVLWTDEGGYDAYRNGLSERGFGEARGRTPAEVAAHVDQLVLHYDACGTSRVCFDVLRDRGLSVHFLLDLDGTLYQTLDLCETAWHATVANGRSIGVEIAQIGAYPPGTETLDEWYPRDAAGPWIRLPRRPDGQGRDGGLLPPGFVGRPARPERTQGIVNGTRVEQHDFTHEQYETLVKLAAGLCRVLPRIRPNAPRGTDGEVRVDALSEADFAAFHGILGHQHVQANKTDPGPAFDWERFLVAVRGELEGERAHP